MITIEQLTESMEAGQPDAILITCEEAVVPLNLPADPEHFAEFAAAVLRCDTVEHVGMSRGWDLWLDEEALGNQPHNALASLFLQVRTEAPSTLHIHGPVLITGHHDDKVEPLAGRDYLQLTTALRQLSEHL